MPSAITERRASRHILLVPLVAAVFGLNLQPAIAQNPRAWAGSESAGGVVTTDEEPAAARDDIRVAQGPSDAAAGVRAVSSQAVSSQDAEPSAGGSPSSQLIPTGNLLSMIASGGVLMLPLVACSFLLAAVGIERVVALRGSRVIPKLFVERFLEQLDAGEFDAETALEACANRESPVANVMAAAVSRWGRPAVEIEQAVIDAGEREITKLGCYRRVFHAVAAVGPLLGLLGTVFGLIRAFNDVAAAGAMGRPDLLAQGFGEALVTTAMGLLVAIPAMVLHSWQTSRIERLAMRLDEVAQAVVQEISAEAAGRPRRQSATVATGKKRAA
jgi:biopolymer transport protein ExbB